MCTLQCTQINEGLQDRRRKSSRTAQCSIARTFTSCIPRRRLTLNANSPLCNSSIVVKTREVDIASPQAIESVEALARSIMQSALHAVGTGAAWRRGLSGVKRQIRCSANNTSPAPTTAYFPITSPPGRSLRLVFVRQNNLQTLSLVGKGPIDNFG